MSCSSAVYRLAAGAVLSVPLVLPLGGCFGSGGSQTMPADFLALGIPTGAASTSALAVSADGSVVVGESQTATGLQQAFVWRQTQGLAQLDALPPGSRSRAVAVSSDGNTVLVNGDTFDSAHRQQSAVYVWTQSGGLERVDPYPEVTKCIGAGLSGDGLTIVGTCLPFSSVAYRWTRGGAITRLGTFGTGPLWQSQGRAISRDGSTAVGIGHPSQTGAVAWAADNSATIIGKSAGAGSTEATAVSANGAWVVGTSYYGFPDPQSAFRWTRLGGLETLGALPAGVDGTSAAAISDDGSIIVGGARTADGDRALIWNASLGLRTLEAALLADHDTSVTGWKLTRATGLSADGRTVVGYGINPQGKTEAFRIHMPR